MKSDETKTTKKCFHSYEYYPNTCEWVCSHCGYKMSHEEMMKLEG